MRFRIPVREWVILFLLPAALVSLYWIQAPADQRPFGIGPVPVLVVIAVFLIWSRLAFTLRIDPDGLVLYRRPKLPWSEVASAELRRVAWMPYLLLRDRRQRQWWVPLYYAEAQDLRKALEQAVPEGHPIRAALT